MDAKTDIYHIYKAGHMPNAPGKYNIFLKAPDGSEKRIGWLDAYEYLCLCRTLATAKRCADLEAEVEELTHQLDAAETEHETP